MEDNDPTGFNSDKDLAAKRAVGINVFKIPPRSPDLNVCDYACWKQVSSKMRTQEESWPKGKKETRQEYIERLRKTAVALDRKFVEASIGDMPQRLEKLYKAKGGLFEEGGR